MHQAWNKIRGNKIHRPIVQRKLSEDHAHRVDDSCDSSGSGSQSHSCNVVGLGSGAFGALSGSLGLVRRASTASMDVIDASMARLRRMHVHSSSGIGIRANDSDDSSNTNSCTTGCNSSAAGGHATASPSKCCNGSLGSFGGSGKYTSLNRSLSLTRLSILGTQLVTAAAELRKIVEIMQDTEERTEPKEAERGGRYTQVRPQFHTRTAKILDRKGDTNEGILVLAVNRIEWCLDRLSAEVTVRVHEEDEKNEDRDDSVLEEIVRRAVIDIGWVVRMADEQQQRQQQRQLLLQSLALQKRIRLHLQSRPLHQVCYQKRLSNVTAAHFETYL